MPEPKKHIQVWIKEDQIYGEDWVDGHFHKTKEEALACEGEDEP